MKLELAAKESKDVLEHFEAPDWVEAVKYVEQNKEKFLEQGHTELSITNPSTKSVCYWKLETEKRPILLADKLHESYKRSR